MLYVVPVLTGTDFSVAEVHQLAEEDVIHSVKWSHPDYNRVPKPGWCVAIIPGFCGKRRHCFSALAAGADAGLDVCRSSRLV